MPSASRTQRVALIGLALNLGLAMLKLLAGIVGHCYALIADAVESIADIVGSVVIWGGLHVGAKPADPEHPYGHGKAESLAALVVAWLVACAGIGIGIKAIDEIRTPHHTPAWWTLLVLVAVVAVKWAMSRWAARVGNEEEKAALAVEAGHHRADVITSLAAFVGISIALAGEAQVFGQTRFNWASADDYAAVLASLVILYNAWGMARVPLHELMDAVPLEALEAAKGATLAVPGVLGIEKTRGRTSGSRHYLEMHVEVDPRMSVADAHVITGKIKQAVRAAVPAVADVHIHVEPHAPPSPVPPVPARSFVAAPGSSTPAAFTRSTTDIHPNP
ncbi:MAG: cation diffusion facilitator family transporter [Thermoleophilia bacterium]|nr:cation diffusion facilitator family transporter [Thermoleophilia bacterium]